MKNKGIKSFVAIALIPMSAFFMAVKPTSPEPSPEPYADEYNDFEYTCTSLTYHESDEEHENPYTLLEFEVTNTGDAYIFDIRLMDFDTNGIPFHYANEESNVISPLYYRLNWDETVVLLGPSLTKTYYCEVNDLTPEQISSPFTLQSGAYYSIAEDCTFNNYEIELETIYNSGNYRYEYFIGFNFDLKEDNSFTYFCFYTFEYHGEEYSFGCNRPQNRAYTCGYILTSEELSIDDIVMKDTTILKGEKRSGWSYPGGRSCTSPGTLTAILLCVLIGITFLGTLAALISVVLIVSIKARKEDAASQDDSSDKTK